jgi:selenocysteine-specific elongation factor SelB
LTNQQSRGAQLTIGVLGHVDHGKTALVKAITGTDTDRLEEEKRRGLSIVLGFAYLEHQQGSIDFIDAPGHEDFIRTMISGATGIDAVMLVIAADEGIKPQTREHFVIAQLLGIKQGLIVINKTDLVDSDVLAATQDEITAAMRGTFLENAPVHTVSAKTGDGIDELTQALAQTIATKPRKVSSDTFYLPLDRVFTIDGMGTVGTGTLRSGIIRSADEVEIMPAATTATIREIQVHGRKVDEASPGQRVAVNLRGVKREQLQRGNVLIRPNSIQETKSLHARFRILNDLPRLPKRNELIRLLFGTTEVLAKMRVAGDDPIEPDTDLLVRFHCRDSVVVNTGEHFIARTSSPAIIFGGGEILEHTAIEKTDNIEVDGNAVSHNIDEPDRDAIDSVEQSFRDGGAMTPSLEDVLGNDPDKQHAYQYLKDAGKLVALKDHSGTKFLVFHCDTIDAIKQQLSGTFPPPSQFTVSDFRQLTGSTRKYVIPMLEYFDRNRITIRHGDVRSLSRIDK